LKNLPDASHNRGMASDIWKTEYFRCSDCGLPYTATREHYPYKHSGSFHCEVCGSKVHVWSGHYDYFDWKVDQIEAPVFGKRWG
jgi:predicted SprT family Zn-dependent metalloprotease